MSMAPWLCLDLSAEDERGERLPELITEDGGKMGRDVKRKGGRSDRGDEKEAGREKRRSRETERGLPWCCSPNLALT